MKYILVVCLIFLVTFVAGKPPCVGCPSTVDEANLKKSEEVLNKSLSKLAAGDGPFYKLLKVNHASTQVVSGKLEKMNADLIDKDEKVKTCDIDIWSQPWLENGITVTFNCPGEDKVVKTHSA